MYCTDCGNDVPDDSKFCPNCGNQLVEEKPSIRSRVLAFIAWKIFSHKVKEAGKPRGSVKDYSRAKRALGWYLVWFTLHLGILLLFSDEIRPERNAFWPLQALEPGVYDIREFTVYTLFPVLILLIYGLLRRDKDIKPEPDPERLTE